jgi:prevent-host-death family protein
VEATTMATKSMNVSEFKAKCLKLVDELEPDGLVLTKRGTPVARIVPIRQRGSGHLVGRMKGRVEVLGDIFSTGEQWDAQS